MTLGIPTPLFWYGVAILCSAASLICIVVAWYRHVARYASLGARWEENCGTLEKAELLEASYRRQLNTPPPATNADRALDRRISVAMEDLAVAGDLDDIVNCGRAPPFEQLSPAPCTGDPFEKLLERIRGDDPCCARFSPNPEDTQ